MGKEKIRINRENEAILRQTNNYKKNRYSIIQILSDGKKHKYGEILERTKFSSKTLADHLKELKPYLEKTEDENDLRIKYYRANPTLMRMLFQVKYLESASEDLRKEFLETKDLSTAIKNINTLTNVNLMMAFTDIKSNALHADNPDILETYFEFLVWSTYEQLTLSLANLCIKTKILADIDLAEATKKLTEK
jgi:DNA-binding HxlR family transcriptional regulator